MKYKIMDYDSVLSYYESDLDLRVESIRRKREELLKDVPSLSEFANGHEYFGIHRTDKGWVYCEWAPAAEEMYLMGDFNGWNHRSQRMHRLDNGIYEIELPADALWEGCRVLAVVIHDGQELARIPAYARRVVQDAVNHEWFAEVYAPEQPFAWTDDGFAGEEPPFIYECHVGMASEDGHIESYTEFADEILPRVKAQGYNTIQMMAVMEHPYYGSFGYQVSNFFAASSRFGRPEELKYLVNKAHGMGIRVLLDVVHSHAAANTREGLGAFDGTEYQYFHAGGKGNHPAWGTKLFNYGKNEVLHFLLSNLKFWMHEYHFDGFRFDGVTSMLYLDHGLGTNFDHYDKYFSMNTDVEAITYLALANELIHDLNKNALTIAEDMSGMPGMCISLPEGGIGFDYRLGMGTPDMWIKFLKEYKDEDWDMWKMWYELTTRRPHEKVIGYAESHDQALVGDKTIMFRLCDKEMYWCMEKSSQNYIIDRGIALHKMIRLITMSLGGDGYLNFMGNEFGHPEWIDFPREGNGWDTKYCRRQWSLVDNADLKYCWLNDFDKAMLSFAKGTSLLSDKEPYTMWVHQQDKVIVYEKDGMFFAFNFNPSRSFEGYFVPVTRSGRYQAVLSTDEGRFGGQDRVSEEMIYQAIDLPDGRVGFFVYLPSRTAAVFRRLEDEASEVKEEKPKRRRTASHRRSAQHFLDKMEDIHEDTFHRENEHHEEPAEEAKEEAPKRRRTASHRRKAEMELHKNGGHATD